MIEIPNFKNLYIQNILFDYNGTLAEDGKVSKEIHTLLRDVCKKYNVFVITADTFGSVKKELKDFDLEVIILSSENHTDEKEDFLQKLGAEGTIALGNGNNDALMLKTAVVSMSILGEEGCAREALFASDIICKNITNAMQLLLHPKRMIATLRK